jgi:hypothetical protein
VANVNSTTVKSTEILTVVNIVIVAPFACVQADTVNWFGYNYSLGL